MTDALTISGHVMEAVACVATAMLLARIRAAVPIAMRRGTSFDRLAVIVIAFFAASGLARGIDVASTSFAAHGASAAVARLVAGFAAVAALVQVIVILGSFGSVLTARAMAIRYPFDRLFEGAPIGLAVVSAGSRRGDRIWGWTGEQTKGRFLRVNPTLCEITGYDREWLQSRTFHDVTTPETLGADLALLAQLDSGAIRRYEVEKEYRRADGRIVPVGLAVSAIRGDGGKILYYLAKVLDREPLVAERRRLQARVDDLEAALATQEPTAVQSLLDQWRREGTP